LETWSLIIHGPKFIEVRCIYRLLNITTVDCKAKKYKVSLSEAIFLGDKVVNVIFRYGGCKNSGKSVIGNDKTLPGYRYKYNRRWSTMEFNQYISCLQLCSSIKDLMQLKSNNGLIFFSFYKLF
jgi:hypothetical protein